MKWLAAAVVLALGSVGCTEGADPAAFAAGSSTAAAGGNPVAMAAGGGCNTSGIATRGGDRDTIIVDRVIAGSAYNDAKKANEDADHTRERHLSRVALALTADQQRAFMIAYEGMERVVKVRKDYAAKTLELAARLDEIDRSDELAKNLSETERGLLVASYGLLVDSPCPARAVRFGGMVLAQTEGAPTRYPGLVGDKSAKQHAFMFIELATAAGREQGEAARGVTRGQACSRSCRASAPCSRSGARPKTSRRAISAASSSPARAASARC
jgi:hypothetical protein